VWELDYDSRGNILSVRDGAGRVLESTLYDGQGRVVAEADRFGATSYEQLTASGQPQRAVDPDGTVTTMAYSPYGEITNMVSPAGSWTFGYDASGRERVADYGSRTSSSWLPCAMVAPISIARSTARSSSGACAGW
jgi:YD repeat-containing protein